MNSGVIIFFLILLFIFALFYVSGKRQQQKEDSLFEKDLKNSVGMMPSKEHKEEHRNHLPGYFRSHPSDFMIDDITYNDLDLDKIYDRIDYTDSAIGEEYLYWLLRTPALKEKDLALSEFQIQAVSGSEEQKIAIKKILRKIRSFGKYSIYDYIDKIGEVKEKGILSNLYPIILLFLSIVVMFFSSRAGILLFLAVIAVNVVTYYRERAEIAPYLGCVKNTLFLLGCAEELCSEKRATEDLFQKETEEMRAILKELSSFRSFAFLLSFGPSSGNPLDILFDYVRILTHLDLLKFYSMIGQMPQQRENIDRIITLIGRIDVTISVSAYRSSLKTYCIPEFLPYDRENLVYEGEDLYHPLKDHPVANSIKSNGHILITGSNASGKSTFLKSAALCSLLSQTLHTAAASSYKANFFRIYSSMALRDNLTKGESYYVVEIKSIKRILDAGSKDINVPILSFVDEILRGTNTVERIASSSEILKSFCGLKIGCFAATHDIELTEILKDDYENYHFDEKIEGDDIIFPYRLMPGKATSRNAILLLKMLGYDQEIIDHAETRAEDFVRTGEWK